jgi:hypothetical protein
MDMHEARQRREDARVIASTAGRRLTEERDAGDERLRGAIRKAFAGQQAAKDRVVGAERGSATRAAVRDDQGPPAS